MMRHLKNLPTYEILTGKVVLGRLTNILSAGHAYFNAEGGFYVLRLSMFGENRYYLKKNPESQTDYTIFADYVRDSDYARFREPVGYGRLLENFSDHLEIDFPLLSLPLYMDLFPTQGGPNGELSK